MLQQSNDQYTEDNVFINPDRTRLELEEFKHSRLSKKSSSINSLQTMQPGNALNTTVKVLASQTGSNSNSTNSLNY